MDTFQRGKIVWVGGKLSDIIKEEWVECIGVGLEVAVVFVQEGWDRAEVAVILGAVVGLMNIFPVGEGEDLLMMEQVSVMNVAIIALVMAG